MAYSRLIGKNKNFNTCAWVIYTSIKIPKAVRQNEAYMSFWTKKKREEQDWDLKRKICKLQVAEKAV